MSDISEHIQNQQTNAAALEAVMGAMLHLIDRPDQSARTLCIQMVETAIEMARDLNRNLDSTALPKGGVE